MEKALYFLPKGRVYIMNRKENYNDLEKWRNTCNKQNRRYYGKTAIYERSRFTLKDCEMILEHSIPDVELSKIIHHSVKSIQIKRSRLLKAMEQ